MGTAFVGVTDEMLVSVSMYEDAASADAAAGVLASLLEPMACHYAKPPQPFAGTLLWRKGSFAQARIRLTPSCTALV